MARHDAFNPDGSIPMTGDLADATGLVRQPDMVFADDVDNDRTDLLAKIAELNSEGRKELVFAGTLALPATNGLSTNFGSVSLIGYGKQSSTIKLYNNDGSQRPYYGHLSDDFYAYGYDGTGNQKSYASTKYNWRSMETDSAHSIKAGDWITVWSDYESDAIDGALNQSGLQHHPGETVRVARVVSDQEILLEMAIHDPMEKLKYKIRSLAKDGIKVANCKFEFGGTRSGHLAEWTTGIDYVVGDYVYAERDDGKWRLWQCHTAHTAAASFSTDQDDYWSDYCSAGGSCVGLAFRGLGNLSIENVDFSGMASGIQLYNCWDVDIRNVRVTDAGHTKIRTATFTTGTDDVLTTSDNHGLVDDNVVRISTTGTFPSATPSLSSTTAYYVVYVADDKFKLSTTAGGGNIVDITDNNGFGTATVYGTVAGTASTPVGIIAACTRVTIDGMYSTYAHHHFDTGAEDEFFAPNGHGETFNTRIGTPREIVVRNWIANENNALNEGSDGGAMFNTHESGWGITFINCQALMCGSNAGTGFLTRSRKTRWIDCIAQGSSGRVNFGIKPQSAGTTYDGSHEITNCSFYDCYAGINSTSTMASIIIRGNLFERCRVGILAFKDNMLITGNTFANIKEPAGGSPYRRPSCIMIYADATNLTITNNDFSKANHPDGELDAVLHIYDDGTNLNTIAGQITLDGNTWPDTGNRLQYSDAGTPTVVSLPTNPTTAFDAFAVKCHEADKLLTDGSVAMTGPFDFGALESQFGTRTDLDNVTSSATDQSFQVRGHSTLNDGGGGTFVYASSGHAYPGDQNTEADRFGLDYINSTGLLFERQVETRVTPQMFGAIPTSDGSGVDRSGPLQRFLNFLSGSDVAAISYLDTPSVITDDTRLHSGYVPSGYYRTEKTLYYSPSTGGGTYRNRMDMDGIFFVPKDNRITGLVVKSTIFAGNHRIKLLKEYAGSPERCAWQYYDFTGYEEFDFTTTDSEVARRQADYWGQRTDVGIEFLGGSAHTYWDLHVFGFQVNIRWNQDDAVQRGPGKLPRAIGQMDCRWDIQSDKAQVLTQYYGRTSPFKTALTGDNGTVTSGSSNTLADTSKNGVWSTNQWANYEVQVNGEIRTIVSNTSNPAVLTISGTFSSPPPTGAYTIGEELVTSGSKTIKLDRHYTDTVASYYWRNKMAWKSAVTRTVTAVTKTDSVPYQGEVAETEVEFTTDIDYDLGDLITFTGLGGMTELNGNTYEIVEVVSKRKIRIAVDSTAFTTYTSNGTGTSKDPIRMEYDGSNWMEGEVDTFDKDTMVLVFTVTSYGGSGFYDDWTIDRSDKENEPGVGISFMNANYIRTGLSYMNNMSYAQYTNAPMYKWQFLQGTGVEAGFSGNWFYEGATDMKGNIGTGESVAVLANVGHDLYLSQMRNESHTSGSQLHFKLGPGVESIYQRDSLLVLTGGGATRQNQYENACMGFVSDLHATESTKVYEFDFKELVVADGKQKFRLMDPHFRRYGYFDATGVGGDGNGGTAILGTWDNTAREAYYADDGMSLLTNDDSSFYQFVEMRLDVDYMNPGARIKFLFDTPTMMRMGAWDSGGSNIDVSTTMVANPTTKTWWSAMANTTDGIDHIRPPAQASSTIWRLQHNEDISELRFWILSYDESVGINTVRIEVNQMRVTPQLVAPATLNEIPEKGYHKLGKRYPKTGIGNYEVTTEGWATSGEWSAGLSVEKYEWRWYNAGTKIRIYRADAAGTTGATPPGDNDNDFNDGTVGWSFFQGFMPDGTTNITLADIRIGDGGSIVTYRNGEVVANIVPGATDADKMTALNSAGSAASAGDVIKIPDNMQIEGSFTPVDDVTYEFGKGTYLYTNASNTKTINITGTGGTYKIRGHLHVENLYTSDTSILRTHAVGVNATSVTIDFEFHRCEAHSANAAGIHLNGTGNTYRVRANEVVSHLYDAMWFDNISSPASSIDVEVGFAGAYGGTQSNVYEGNGGSGQLYGAVRVGYGESSGRFFNIQGNTDVLVSVQHARMIQKTFPLWEPSKSDYTAGDMIEQVSVAGVLTLWTRTASGASGPAPWDTEEEGLWTSIGEKAIDWGRITNGHVNCHMMSVDDNDLEPFLDLNAFTTFCVHDMEGNLETGGNNTSPGFSKLFKADVLRGRVAAETDFPTPMQIGEIETPTYTEWSATPHAVVEGEVTLHDSLATTAQVETIDCVADVSDSLDKTWFKLYDEDGSVGVWIDVDDDADVTFLPAAIYPACDRYIEVTGVVTNDTATAVAAAVKTAIHADSKFSATSSVGEVTVTHATAGAVQNGVDGNTGFTFDVDTHGVGGVSTVWRSKTARDTTATWDGTEEAEWRAWGEPFSIYSKDAQEIHTMRVHDNIHTNAGIDDKYVRWCGGGTIDGALYQVAIAEPDSGNIEWAFRNDWSVFPPLVGSLLATRLVGEEAEELQVPTGTRVGDRARLYVCGNTQNLTLASGWEGEVTDIEANGWLDIVIDPDGTPRVMNVAKPIPTHTWSSAKSLTAAQCFGGQIHYIGGTSGLVNLPAVQPGMNVTIIAIAAITVVVSPDDDDKIWRDGAEEQADGEDIDSPGAIGDAATLSYFSEDGWWARTNSWTNGG